MSSKTASNPGIMISGSGGIPLTVGDIRNAIYDLDNDVEINFGSTLAGDSLNFYRFKWRGDKLLQIELNEDDSGLSMEEETTDRLTLKTFHSSTTASIESSVNNWLSDNSNIKVVSTQTAHAITEIGGNQRSSTIISIWYSKD